jgi:HlyD family secretion protein
VYFGSMKKSIIRILLVVLITGAGIVTALSLVHSYQTSQTQPNYETAVAAKGDLKLFVTATGTIQAIRTVKVGTQVSGKISKLNITYNSRVKAGELLAELDRKPLETATTITQAALDEAKASMAYQESNFRRQKTLFENKVIAESAYDEALYSLRRAETALKTAQLNSDQAKINLGYAFIQAPIDGVVLDCAVSEGQTVAASLNTPTLFTIANDLTQMQVEASIDEADIGQEREGQRVTFTVDAFPDDLFTGEVTQIRLQPVTTSNVVTYTVIVKAPNDGLKLMPGMTASIRITVQEAAGVLTIPSQALQFDPGTGGAPEQVAVPASPPPGDSSLPGSGSLHRVWVRNGAGIRPALIFTGLDDESAVQVISGLHEGDTVILTSTGKIELSTVAAEAAGSNSPFMPKPPSGKQPPPQP